MLTLSPERLAYETQRAEENQRADDALRRERIGWFCLAVLTVWVGCAMAAMGLHVARRSLAAVWIGGGLLVGQFGPMVILLVAVKREEM